MTITKLPNGNLEMTADSLDGDEINMKPYMPLDSIIKGVAEGLARGNDHSATTIRCAINDAMDSASKDGYRVKDDYSQPLAVARVKRLIVRRLTINAMIRD